MNTTHPTGRQVSRLASLKRSFLSLIAAGAMVASLLTVAAPPASAAPELPNGLTSGTAAGSCWEAKQNYPSSDNGIYWLLTPTLKAPQQFYCDMTTDGGGWVLIARGREGWKGQYNGLRSPDTLRNVIDGPQAFAPAELPALTVDALLNGTPVKSLTDGVRLRRAVTQDGSQRQEVRFTMPERDRWVWTFEGLHALGTYSFDGVTGSGGSTRSFGKDTSLLRVDTNAARVTAQRFLGGFAYGANITGSTSSTSYLWSSAEGGASARPFTQMFLRPKLKIAEMIFAAIPDSGAPATAQRALADSNAMKTVWGVSGQANGLDTENDVQVAAFTQIGNTVYVGGNFKYVQRTQNATGTDLIQQSSLAAFDVNTGEWKSTFRPQVNGQVKALIPLPDGRLAVGGQFTQVNGVAKAAFVILDPATGATSPGWQLNVENRTAGGLAHIRGFSIQGNWLYVAGSFTHWLDPGGVTASTWNGARINLTTGAPDTNWNPLLNGTSVGVDAPASGTRTYFSGYFRQSGQIPTLSATALQTSAGAAVVQPLWKPTFSDPKVDVNGNVTGAIWQLGVQEVAGRVWLGGSQHSLFTYNVDDFSLMNGNITRNGGDFQAIEATGNTVFAGCHCGDWTYSDTYSYGSPQSNATQIDKANLVGAWDATTGAYLPQFSPVLQARKGYGAWSLFTDSTGNQWIGGDFLYSVRAGEVNQWSGGFIRFAQRDAAAPSAPTGLTASSVGASTATLTWAKATDDRGSVQYEVIRDNKVVRITSATTADVPTESTPTRYFVRAVDPAGNRSATTPVYTLAPPSAADLTFVSLGSSWKWRFDSAALPASWNTTAFDDSTWPSGSAVLGLGSSGLGTNISVGAPSPRPLSAQYRRAFTVTDPTTVEGGLISVTADDGVVVYVNGTEVGRAAMPTGTLTQSSYATAAPRTATAPKATFTVPSSVLVEGTNVVSASTHVNYRTTLDVSFDLRFTARRGLTPPPVAPAAPVVTATAASSSSVQLSWTAADAASIAEYRVSRGGTQIGVVAAPATTFTDTGLAPATSYGYSVTAVGTNAQLSTSGTASATTSAAAGAAATFVASGASWTWRFDSALWPVNWNSTFYDDSAWPAGTAVLGFGTAGQSTDISVGVPTPRPLSAQFRSGFQLSDPETIKTAQINVVANDGVVVYVNGTEVGRSNLPAGTLTQNSYATAAPRSGTAAVNRVTFTVPVSLLIAGNNVVAASTHVNYRTTPDVSYDLAFTGTR